MAWYTDIISAVTGWRSVVGVIVVMGAISWWLLLT
jgi:predicted MFS family arabinose efflux permease